MGRAIQEVIDTILKAMPDVPLQDTVDTCKSGDPTRQVTGIVTTFLASYEVIQRAIELGANLIITHEPTFYGHRDEVDWLAGDSVYEAKRQLLEKNGIVVWRFHDYWHSYQPDGIITGVIKELGWEKYARPDTGSFPIYALPPTSVRDLALHLKGKLGAQVVRVVGSLEMICRRAGLAVGASGGRWHIQFLGKEDVDVLIAGEVSEWETAEYVRDAGAQGKKLALILVGHANSEEPGMEYLVEWLRPRFPDLAISHVPTGDPFHSV
jgi:putative NIF3 family GTP cyclohydrolase 1 type 2